MDTKRFLLTATIGLGGSKTEAVDLFGDVLNGNVMNGSSLVGIVMPSGWDTASMTFDGSFDGSTYNPIYDPETGSELVFQAAASRFLIVPPALFIAPRFIKVRSGTNASPVAQTAARSLGLVVRSAA